MKMAQYNELIRVCGRRTRTSRVGLGEERGGEGRGGMECVDAERGGKCSRR